MNENKWTIDELETMYITQYSEEKVENDTGDEVQNFLNWCRTNLTHI